MNLTSWTKRLMVAGLIALPVIGMYLDMSAGKELALLVIGGFLARLKGD